MVSLTLGGGRETKESKIDLSVGVVLKKKVVERQIRMKLNYEYSYGNHLLIINAEKFYLSR